MHARPFVIQSAVCGAKNLEDVIARRRMSGFLASFGIAERRSE